jgi:hypothetical protein
MTNKWLTVLIHHSHELSDYINKDNAIYFHQLFVIKYNVVYKNDLKLFE